MHAAASASTVPAGLLSQTRLNNREIAERFFEFDTTSSDVW
jgi:hypothetical protein